MSRPNSELPSPGDVQRYLRDGIHALRCAQQDTQCVPFIGYKSASSNADAPSLFFAVDWSDVFAYICLDGAKRGPMSEILGEPLAEAAHQAALTFLFESLDVSLALLPPHVSELQRFITRLKTAEALFESALDAAAVQRTADSVYARSEHLAAILEWVKLRADGSGRRKGPLKYDDLLRHLKQSNPAANLKPIREWLEQEFGDLFLLSRLWSSSAVHALSYLLHGDHGDGTVQGRSRRREAPLVGASDQLRTFPVSFWRPSPRRVDEWLRRLRNENQTKKEDARERDARAIDLLDRLNGELHARRTQLLFITRSEDICAVLDRSPGRFACISRPYAQLPGQRTVPTILRNWRYFYELGVCWSEDPKRTRSVIDRRLTALELQLENVSLGLSRAVIKQICSLHRAETRKELSNKEIFVSVRKPRVRPRGKLDEQTLHLRVFVDFITGDPSMSPLRDQARVELARGLDELDNHVLLEPRLDRASYSSQIKPLTIAAIEKIPDSILLSGITNSRRPLVRRLTGYIKREPNARYPREELKRVPSPTDTSLEPARRAEIVTLRALAIFAAGYFRRLKHVLEPHDDVSPPPFSGNWLLLNLLRADTSILVDRAVDHAKTRLERLRESCRDEWPPQTTDGRAIAAGMISCELLLWLDDAFPGGDDATSLPVGSMLSLTQLKSHLARLDTVIPKPLSQQWPRRLAELRRSIANNITYGWGIAAVLSFLSTKDAMEWEKFKAAAEEFRRARELDLLSARLAKVQDASLQDTSGVFHLALAALCDPATTDGRKSCRLAEDAFRRAHELAAEADDDRLRRFVRWHQTLLSRVTAPVGSDATGAEAI